MRVARHVGGKMAEEEAAVDLEAGETTQEEATEEGEGQEAEEDEDDSEFDDPEGFIDDIPDEGFFPLIVLLLLCDFLFVRVACRPDERQATGGDRA